VNCPRAVGIAVSPITLLIKFIYSVVYVLSYRSKMRASECQRPRLGAAEPGFPQAARFKPTTSSQSI